MGRAHGRYKNLPSGARQGDWAGVSCQEAGISHMPMLPHMFFTASCAISVIIACGAMRT